MIKALTFAVTTVMAIVGAWLVSLASNAVEYSGGAVLIGGAIAGVYGLLRRLSEDHKASDQWSELVDVLQRDNDRLRRALREAEERNEE